MSWRALKTCFTGAAAGAAVISCGVTNPQPGGGGGDGPFYEGAEITLIVPFDAGGASDVFSRLFAGYLSEAIEGEPDIIIENVPGGAQKEGMNQFERMEHDGLSIAMGSGGLVTATHFDTEGIQFDLEDYETLVAFGGSMMIFGSVEAGITSLEGLTETEDTLYYGGMELNASEAARVYALDEMGFHDFEPLMGYDGGGSVTAAVLRSELSMGNSTSSHYTDNVLPLEEEGEITPLMTQGFVVDGEVVRDPAFPELPTMVEAYESLTGETPEGPGWEAHMAITTAQTNLLRTYWIHGEAPDEAREALREAVEEVVTNDDFIQESTELLGIDSPPLLGEEAEASMAEVRDLPPETVQWVKDYIDEVNAR